MILYRVAPGKWLTIQVFLFGLVRMFQAWQSNYSGSLATRFLLGVTESGYIPVMLRTLSTWHTRSETLKRVMIFFFGNQLGQTSSKLITYGELQMKGVGGHPGWFWLFVIMGAFTIREGIGLDAFKKAFSNWRIWIHVSITLANNVPIRGFDTYSPSIIKDLGYLALQSNAMAAVGLFLQVPVSFVLSWISDRFNYRGETFMAGIGMHLLGYVFNRIFTGLKSEGARYSGVRPLAMGMIIMSTNIGAIYGAQLFQSDDKPLYGRGFSINIGLLAFGLTLVALRQVDQVIRLWHKA
ncbi:hypothetical protein NM208_g4479 [Fusarium decemcellulare]|uniref:Uncharacterized protein n=2 Tax=Fusarium decemcellulare TaxID=57161 RepID=A0ACC1SKK0_9HYPO|nr:hypothetical protein NM208_g5174 [Fusarium decemcellulare]KAJ3541706.1 hypothetical protein NM208_g4479 [Fusarium decemcellulare]